jgi:outer membrane biosynthesis protein TonB
MSDDVFEAFGGDNIFNDDEEPRQAEGEGQNNRTFILAVAVLGGLLVFAVGAFMVWALVLNKPVQIAQAPIETPADTATVEVMVVADTPEPTETPVPTNTPPPPTPSPTPLLGPTNTPEGEAVAEGAEPEGTQVVRRTPTPTATLVTVVQSSGAGATTSGGTASGTTSGPASGTAGSAQLSQTGLGEWVLIGVAVLFLATMILARRLRSA